MPALPGMILVMIGSRFAISRMFPGISCGIKFAIVAICGRPGMAAMLPGMFGIPGIAGVPGLTGAAGGGVGTPAIGVAGAVGTAGVVVPFAPKFA